MFSDKLPKKKILGLYILLLGIIFLFKVLFYEKFTMTYILLVIGWVISIEMIIRSIVRKNIDKSLYVPGTLLFMVILFLFVYFLFLKDTDFYFSKIWPLLGVFPGISLISYYFIFKPRSPSTIVPGVFITIMSFILLLSRFDVLNINFKMFLLLLFPFFFILLGLYLIFNENFEKKFKKKQDQ